MSHAEHKEEKLLLLQQEEQQLERDLAGRYAALGREVYEAAERSIGEIGEIVDRLVALRIEACSLQGMAACPHCLTNNPVDNNYCRHCGKELSNQKEDAL